MKGNKIKISKTVLVLSIISAILLTIIPILWISLSFFKSVGNFFLIYIRNPIAGLLYNFFESMPEIGIKIHSILAFMLFILILIVICTLIFKKMKNRNIIFNISLAIFSFMLVLTTSISLLNVVNYTSLIDRYHMEDRINKEYKKEDIVILHDSLLNKVMEMSLEFDRDENGDIVYNDSLEDTAINSLLNISDDYKFLRGHYPRNYKKLLPGNKYYDGLTLGVTEGFGVSIDYSSNKAELLNTITHELCHTKGIIRENEAVFCSFLAGINSEDNLAQYAAYLEAFMRVDSALGDIDAEMELEKVEPLLKLCINEGFKEICEIYPKMTDNYIKKAKELEFVSYPLIDYKNHLGEIIGILSSLQEDGGQIYIDDSYADMDYVLALIQNDSYKIVKVKFKNSEGLFNRLKPVMEENSNLFMAIQQINKEDKKRDKSPEEYLNYYLEKNESDNVIEDFLNMFINGKYDYSRVVRLLLEYYDGQEILPYES